jgi:type 1 glutamine amidotransferase
MNGIRKNLRWVIIISSICAFIFGCTKTKNEDLIKVLILSGKNNHEWQKTTPVLMKMYKETNLFEMSVTDLPDTLKYSDMKQFDVMVSNWNMWPDSVIRLTKEWENDFSRYVKNGGGVVTFHAGATSFYKWDNYHKVGIGRWGKDTKHSTTRGKITVYDQQHPVTKGISDFYITDEIWEKTDIDPDAKPLASVTATDMHDGHQIIDNAVFVSKSGRGRTFYIILGHDQRAMLNSGLQTLLLRATQWAAKRDVTIEPPAELSKRIVSTGSHLNWQQSDTTLALLNNSDKVWQFNFNNRFGRPYFHPLNAERCVITCTSPPDHPWHLGFWFCWKYINGVNYWEYLDDFKSEETGYRSAGITETSRYEIKKNLDFSADISMDLNYHPDGGKTILTEKREIFISPLNTDGSYYIDHSSEFTPVADEVILDRTPIQTEPDGKSWGGYAGLSIRFSQDFSSPVIIARSDSENYRKNDWVYMGFNTLSGRRTGVCIFQNRNFTTSKTSWYFKDEPEVPFFYYTPALLYDGKIILKKGEVLMLKYRMWVLPGETDKEQLQKRYDEYVTEGLKLRVR